jgi:DNA-binding response OmpR family regulator
MDGASLIRAVRLWIPRQPRIIAMTGADYLDREQVVSAAAAERPDTILLKPFSLVELLNVMRARSSPRQGHIAR